MNNYACPSCGAEIFFKSSVSIYTTCDHCRSNVVRHDMDLELLGKQSLLIRDMSPFQVGTRGVYNEKRFELLGRIKVLYDRGTWSEWYALFEEGTEGWLAEAQGKYMMSFEIGDGFSPPASHTLKPEAEIDILGDVFVVEDMQTITYAASEGELPFMFYQGYQGKSIDLRGTRGKFASFLYDKEGTQTFLGEYQPFESFQFQNLRTIDGW